MVAKEALVVWISFLKEEGVSRTNFVAKTSCLERKSEPTKPEENSRKRTVTSPLARNLANSETTWKLERNHAKSSPRRPKSVIRDLEVGRPVFSET